LIRKMTLESSNYQGSLPNGLAACFVPLLKERAAAKNKHARPSARTIRSDGLKTTPRKYTVHITYAIAPYRSGAFALGNKRLCGKSMITNAAARNIIIIHRLNRLALFRGYKSAPTRTAEPKIHEAVIIDTMRSMAFTSFAFIKTYISHLWLIVNHANPRIIADYPGLLFCRRRAWWV